MVNVEAASATAAHPNPETTVGSGADKVNQLAGGDQTSSLSAKANLGTVDHGSFAQATQDSQAGSTAGDHLPSVTVPVSLDKGVQQSYDQLSTAASSAISDPAVRKQFLADMNTFEKRAETAGLTASQIGTTYQQMALMLQPAPNSPLSASQRLEAATQWMSHLANPEGTTRQGWHDTCSWTSLETEMLTANPDKITEKMTELVTTGGVSTVDVKKMMDMVTTAGNSPSQADQALPTKQLKIDPGSLQPDEEAQGAFHHGDDRLYVDQLAQVMLNNIAWDANPTAPDGTNVGPGALQYEQGPTISRPSDGTPTGTGKDESGESVTWIDPKTGKRVVDTANGYGIGGAATPAQAEYVNGVVTGNLAPVELARTNNGPPEIADSIVGVKSLDDLKATLKGFQSGKQVPVMAMVEVDNPGIVGDYLARHPELNAASVPKNSWHSILINGVDSKGDVEIYNPWGLEKKLTPEQLYVAMGNPAS